MSPKTSRKSTRSDTSNVAGSARSRLKFGWIDLEKSRLGFTLLILIILTVATVFSMVLVPWTDQDSRSGGLTTENFFSTLIPFSGTANGEGDVLPLSKEYLYTESGMFAVEDAGATSAPPADLAIWRPSTGQWWTMAGTGTRQMTVSWGVSGDIPAIGDYDGDGKTDFCVFRPQEGLWYLINSGTGDSSTSVISFGGDGDLPAQADFDGDGKTDIAVFRPDNGRWFIKRSSDQGITELPLGTSNDTPSPKDFDGDGKADVAVWRAETGIFYSINSSDGELQFTGMGASGEAVPGDYDGDGRDDFAVRNGTQWMVRRSTDGSISESSFQSAGDIAVQNDYDGDGKVDIAVWRPSEGRWFISQSSNGVTRTELWGGEGDIPLPALYRR